MPTTNLLWEPGMDEEVVGIRQGREPEQKTAVMTEKEEKMDEKKKKILIGVGIILAAVLIWSITDKG